MKHTIKYALICSLLLTYNPSIKAEANFVCDILALVRGRWICKTATFAFTTAAEAFIRVYVNNEHEARKIEGIANRAEGLLNSNKRSYCARGREETTADIAYKVQAVGQYRTIVQDLVTARFNGICSNYLDNVVNPPLRTLPICRQGAQGEQWVETENGLRLEKCRIPN